MGFIDMFYVLDQSILRHPDLVAMVQQSSTAAFILPDTCFIEMMKNALWEGTLRRSLAALRPAVERCHVARSIPECLRLEMDRSRAIGRSQLLADDLTRFGRDLIVASGVASSDPAWTRLRRDIEAVRADVLEEELNAPEERRIMAALLRAFEQDGGPEALSRPKQDGTPPRPPIALLREIGQAVLRRDFGLAPAVSAAFVKEGALLLRYLYLRAWYVMTWIQDRGFEQVDAGKVLNDRLDLDWLLVGSYFDDILSKDKKALRADAVLRTLVAGAT